MDLATTLKKFSGAVERNDGGALAELFTADGVYDDYFWLCLQNVLRSN